MIRSTGANNRHLFDQQSIVGPAGTVAVVRMMRQTDALIVSVKMGGLDLWFGEWSGSPLPTCPHLHFGQQNGPVWVPMPGNQQAITVQLVGPGDPCIASVIQTGC